MGSGEEIGLLAIDVRAQDDDELMRGLLPAGGTADLEKRVDAAVVVLEALDIRAVDFGGAELGEDTALLERGVPTEDVVEMADGCSGPQYVIKVRCSAQLAEQLEHRTCSSEREAITGCERQSQ